MRVFLFLEELLVFWAVAKTLRIALCVSRGFHQTDILNFNVDSWLSLGSFVLFLRENTKELPAWEGFGREAQD